MVRSCDHEIVRALEIRVEAAPFTFENLSAFSINEKI